MAQQYDNEMTFVLFPTKEKKTANSPDYWGKMTVGGNELRLSGWKKTGPKGTFLSGKISDPLTEQPKQQQGEGDGFDDDSIPF